MESTKKKIQALQNNIENNTEINDLAETMLDLGTDFLLSGAEVSRVEDMLEHIGLSFGAANVNVYVITSVILLTIYMPDGMVITQTRNVQRKGGTDFFLLEELNALSRTCYSEHLSLGELRKRYAEIKKKDDEITQSRSFTLVSYISSIAVASGFTVFFGGNAQDAAAAAIPAVFICFMTMYFSEIFTNKIVFNFFGALFSGVMVCWMSLISPGLKADIIMIGNIMLLIPGVAMTNAVRGMLMGDTISGLMRLIETMLWSGALAAGFVVAILFTNSNAQYHENLYVSAPVQLVSVFIGVAGLCVLFRLKKEHWLAASIGAIPVYALYLWINSMNCGIFVPFFAATVLAALYSEIMAIVRKAPATLFVIPTVLSLIPGGGLFYMLSGTIRKNADMFQTYANTTLTTAVAIASGILIVFTFWDMYRKVMKRAGRFNK